MLRLPDKLPETETNWLLPTKHFHQVQTWTCWLVQCCMSNIKHSLSDLLGEEKMVIPGVKYKGVCTKEREKEG